jgi:hypothetical protein
VIERPDQILAEGQTNGLEMLVDVPSGTSIEVVKMNVNRCATRFSGRACVQSRSKQTRRLSFLAFFQKAFLSVTRVYSVACGTRGSTIFGEVFVRKLTSEQSDVGSVSALSDPRHDVEVKPHQRPEVNAKKARGPPWLLDPLFVTCSRPLTS